MDKLYNKKDCERAKFDPLNNYDITTLCKTHNPMCKTHKTNYALYVKKTVVNTTAFAYIIRHTVSCKTAQSNHGISEYPQEN